MEHANVFITLDIYTPGLFADSEEDGRDTGKYKNRIRSGRRGAYYLCGGHIFSQKVQKRYKIPDSRKSYLSKILISKGFHTFFTKNHHSPIDSINILLYNIYNS